MLAAQGFEPTDPLLGTELPGGYRIERLLSRGGMGAVYQAEQLRFRRRVAVKVLSDSWRSDAELVARFEREAEIVSGVEHPHVVRVLDAGRTDQGIPYLVMEYLEGETLRQRLTRDRVLPVLEAVRIVSYLCSALAEVHGRGFVHCDLKPSNVFLVRADGLPDVVKLLDFGVSVSASRLPTDEVREIAGTPSYMAPEQAQGRSDLDHRVDQFAIAAIAYEMLSGKKAFSPDMPFTDPRPLSEIAPWVPSDLEPVLRRGLSRDRDLRYSGISRFAWALEKAGTHACMEPAHALGSTLAMSRYHLAGLREEHVFAQTEPSSCPPTRVEARVKMLRPASSSAQSRAEALLALARRHLNDGQLDLAVEQAEALFDLGLYGHDSKALEVVASSMPLLDRIFATRVGPLDRLLVVTASSEEIRGKLSPRATQLLSYFGHPISIASALAVSGIPNRDTIRLLAGLLRRGTLTDRASVPPAAAV
jgi:eukaryotic-like serine/threonine-protein kinase